MRCAGNCTVDLLAPLPDPSALLRNPGTACCMSSLNASGNSKGQSLPIRQIHVGLRHRRLTTPSMKDPHDDSPGRTSTNTIGE